ncbi:MAG: hypothetical protein ACK5NF_05075 [Bacilli bacterium]
MRKVLIRKPIIIIQVAILLIIITCAVFYVNSNKKYSKNHVNQRIELLEAVIKDDKDENNAKIFIEKKGYEVYAPSTFKDKYTYIKKSKDVIINKYDDKEYSKDVFYYIKDYSIDNDLKTNFVFKSNTKDYEYGFSIHNKIANTIFIEKKVFTDCSVNKCISNSSTIEVHYLQYLYDVKANTISNYNFPKENNLDLKDVESEINKFFDELVRLYKDK